MGELASNFSRARENARGEPATVTGSIPGCFCAKFGIDSRCRGSVNMRGLRGRVPRESAVRPPKFSY
jgi:hypothetical protein